jgi:radical SAM protein with 4Fe4S-binding SPASM domain
MTPIILSTGHVYFCPCAVAHTDKEHRIGNIAEHLLLEIYNSERVRQLWNYKDHMPEVCNTCGYWYLLSIELVNVAVSNPRYFIVG